MPKHAGIGRILITTDDPIGVIWEEFSLYDSLNLARRLIQKKSAEAQKKLDSKVVDEKAIALAYCIRNARENICLETTSMTARAMAHYYGALWLACALAVANPLTDADLSSVEKVTTQGHGLGNIQGAGVFPFNEYIYVKGSGFLHKFLLWIGLEKAQLTSLSFPHARPEKYELIAEDDRKFFIRITELFARIPELTRVYEQVTGQGAMNFQFCQIPHQTQPDSSIGETVIGVLGDYPRQHLEDCGIPFRRLEECLSGPFDRADICKWKGAINHPPHTNFFNNMYENPVEANFYVSPLANYFFISPLLEHIKHPLVIHLMLCYQLSILARYRPAVWREILEGELDEYRILISAYQRMFTRVVPHIVLNALLDRRITIPMPGTLA